MSHFWHSPPHPPNGFTNTGTLSYFSSSSKGFHRSPIYCGNYFSPQRSFLFLPAFPSEAWPHSGGTSQLWCPRTLSCSELSQKCFLWSLLKNSCGDCGTLLMFRRCHAGVHVTESTADLRARGSVDFSPPLLTSKASAPASSQVASWGFSFVVFSSQRLVSGPVSSALTQTLTEEILFRFTFEMKVGISAEI